MDHCLLRINVNELTIFIHCSRPLRLPTPQIKREDRFTVRNECRIVGDNGKEVADAGGFAAVLFVDPSGPRQLN